MDLENKVIGFQFEPERSIFNHEGFYQDSSDEGDAIKRDMLDRKDCDPSVWCKRRNCSETENRKGMSVLSRSGGSARCKSPGYICPESSNNFSGIKS